MKRDDLTCGAVKEQLALLFYGELSFDEEERVESHLDGCAECRASLARERAVHAAFDSAAVDPPASLLRECREDLRARLMDEPAPVAGSVRRAWFWTAIDAITLRPSSGILRPLGATALVALGFGLAHLAPAIGAGGGFGSGFGAMSLADTGARVRRVEPASEGRVQIVLDETRQRTVEGRLDDQKIRALLVEATRDPSDTGLRADTVEILISRAQFADVRDALVYEMQHDPNVGVRMKAMAGLKPLVAQPEVRAALEQVLFTDAHPGLRTQAIDLLTGGANASIDRHVDREIVGTLQELIERGEQQGYVRERCRSVLQAVNASLETY